MQSPAAAGSATRPGVSSQPIHDRTLESAESRVRLLYALLDRERTVEELAWSRWTRARSRNSCASCVSSGSWSRSESGGECAAARSRRRARRAAGSRNREQLEWIADQVVEAGGDASIWTATPAALAQEREIAAAMQSGIAEQYLNVIEQARRARAPEGLLDDEDDAVASPPQDVADADAVVRRP
jgi:hypothetical protein